MPENSTMKFEIEPQEAEWLINFIARHATIMEGVGVWVKLKEQAQGQLKQAEDVDS